jgi:hypothetical protein
MRALWHENNPEDWRLPTDSSKSSLKAVTIDPCCPCCAHEKRRMNYEKSCTVAYDTTNTTEISVDI